MLMLNEASTFHMKVQRYKDLHQAPPREGRGRNKEQS